MSKNIEVRFAKIQEQSDAKIPSKIEENAGYDIYACFEEDYLKIPAHYTVLVPTGIASAFSSDYYFQIEERSSTGKIGLKKSAGVFDSGYRGEWFIALTNTNDIDVWIVKSDLGKASKNTVNFLKSRHEIIVYPYEKAIAQAVLHRVLQAHITEMKYSELKEIPSERGTGAFGSTGK